MVAASTISPTSSVQDGEIIVQGIKLKNTRFDFPITIIRAWKIGLIIFAVEAEDILENTWNDQSISSLTLRPCLSKIICLKI